MASYNPESSRYTTVKLNDRNYNHWSLMTQMILLKEGLWPIITDAPPEERNSDWRKRDDSAKATIILSLEESQTHIIRDCKTAQQVWQKIKKTKEFASLSSKRNLRKKLNTAHLEDGKPMNEYLDGIVETAYQLNKLGEDIDEEQVISIILGGLPESYDALVTVLETLPTEKITLEYLKNKLLDESQKRNTRNEERKRNHAYWSYREPNRTKSCFICNSTKHFKRDCPMKVENQQDTNRDRKVNCGEKLNYNQSDEEDHQTTEKQKSYMAFTANSIKDNKELKNLWIIDSGANAHMTHNKELFDDIILYDTPDKVKLADGKEMEIKGKGTCHLTQTDNKELTGLQLNEVLFIPDLETNLLSVGKILDRDYDIEFNKNQCNISKEEKLIAIGLLHEGIYAIKLSKHQTEQINTACIHEWHLRLGHRNLNDIKKLSQFESIKNMNIKNCNCKDECITCVRSCMTRLPYKSSRNNKYYKAFQHLNSDLCGPVSPTTLGRGKYFVTISDEFTKFTTTYIIHSKDETADQIINFINEGKNKFGYWPESFRSDGGGEYANEKLDKYFTSNGIVHELSVAYCPQQNGSAERKNRTLLNMTRCLLLQKNLPKFLWGEAILTSTHIYNCFPHHKTELIPYQQWHGRDPDINQIHTFGSSVYFLTEKWTRGKMDNVSIPGIFVGFCRNTKAYRIWLPNENKIVIRRNLKFITTDHKIDPTTDQELTCNDYDDHFVELEFYENHQEQEENLDIQVIPRRSNRITQGIPPTRLITECP